MKKLYLILFLLFTAIFVTGCAEQIMARPRAGINLIGNNKNENFDHWTLCVCVF